MIHILRPMIKLMNEVDCLDLIEEVLVDVLAVLNGF